MSASEPPLPEPWDGIAVRTHQQDRHPPSAGPRSIYSWASALDEHSSPFILAYAFTSVGAASLRLRGTIIAMPAWLAVLFLVIGSIVYLWASLVVAIELWNSVLGPFFRAQRQISDRGGALRNAVARILLAGIGATLTVLVVVLAIRLPELLLFGGLLALMFNVTTTAQVAVMAFLLPLMMVWWSLFPIGKGDYAFAAKLRIRVPDEVQTAARRTLMVHHLSDLHLLDADRSRSAEGDEIDPQQRLREALAAFADRPPVDQLVVVTGDITDTGAAHAWRSYFDWLDKVKSLQMPLAFVPGNHDLNIVTSEQLTLTGHKPSDYLKLIRYLPMESPERRQQEANMLRCLLAMAKHHGDHAQCLRDGEIIGLASLLQSEAVSFDIIFRQGVKTRSETHDPFDSSAPRDEHGSIIVDDPEHGGLAPERVDCTDPLTRAAIDMPRKLWETAWPMIVSLPEQRCTLILLNSTRLSRSVADNAFGMVGDVQLSRALELHSKVATAGWPTLVLLHHSPARGGGVKAARTKSAFLCLEDVDRVVSTLSHLEPVYFSGHTHWKAGDDRWRAAPSLGFAGTHHASLCTYVLTIDAQGRVVDIVEPATPVHNA